MLLKMILGIAALVVVVIVLVVVRLAVAEAKEEADDIRRAGRRKRGDV